MTKLMSPPDQQVRQQAINAEESFIVQAPAGAGKTSLLTQRILNVLTTVEHPEEVVAMTFTRKAAAEMRHRLVESLLMAQGSEPEDAHQKTTWQLAKKVLQRDSELEWNLLQNSHRLRVTTIDSLSSMIANQMPVLSHSGGSLSITNYPQESYRRAAESILSYLDDADYGTHILKLLAHLDNQVEKLIGLLAQMLGKRDQWLRLLGAGELDIDILEDGINQIAQMRLQKLKAFQPAIEASGLLRGIHFASGFLEAKHELSALKDIDSLPELDYHNLEKWKALASFCLTGKGKFRKRLDKGVGLLADTALQGEDKKVGKALKAELKELFSEWAEIPEFAETLNDIVSLPKPVYSPEQQDILYSLLHLLRLVSGALTVDFQSNAEADFIEIALAADRALGFFDEPSELALKLDYQIKHLLVDEFQDTSFTQYQLLSKLISGWQVGDGRTLFLVGDPMQSIYRFREANVGLFIKTQQEGINNFSVTSLQLTANFRSSPSIIDWVNRRFEKIFPVNDDALLGAVSYSKAEAMKPDDEQHFVNFNVSFDMAGNNEAEQLAETIQQTIVKHPDESIAVLVRGRNHAQDLMGQLRASGISYYAKDMEYLSHKPCVSDIMVLGRLLLHPQDGIAWVALLKSPLIGLTLSQITHLHRTFGHHFWRWLEECETLQELDSDTTLRLSNAKTVISPILEDAGRKPLSQLVEAAWLALGGPSALLDDAERKDVYAVFELLMELEQVEWPLTFERINTAVTELFADQQADSAQVEIMTMHKSKGLEFDTVILPSLQRQKRADDHQLLLWEEFTVEDRAGYLLAPIQGAEQKDPIYQLARDIQSKKSVYEDARLLYVAATRAKKRLVLSCELKLKFDEEKSEWSYSSVDKRSLLHYLLPYYENLIEKQFNEVSANINTVSDEHSELSFYDGWYRLHNDFKTPHIENQLERSGDDLIEQEEVDFDWASDIARVVGLVVHKQLELIASQRQSFEELEASDYETIEVQLKELLHTDNDVTQAFQKAKQALSNVKNDEKGQWLLHKHQDSRCEWELTGTVADSSGRPMVRSFIIDRSFIDEQGTRWIIDYKTGDHKGSDVERFINAEVERYANQLKQYQHIVGKFEQRPSRMALYFPLLKQFVEISG
ncbi:UvrD-helicase domain-containing protein [Kangiella geojedonensis]|uniref:DNA 3'-5' helicase n=1 Tax=Kangiella geojedonensis TaxID=914150 RepID=A0A0F6TRQ0_9GAMM|nr:UvrD-helicase domain-containing protein [Kangiella geojedonensis]AKE52594.1 UvrD/REP helicase [Kangiella geojedonensis]